MSRPYLLFLHGINAKRELDWLTPLNDALSWFGVDPFRMDRVVAPYYRDRLQGDQGLEEPPPITWRRPDEQRLLAAETEYLVTSALLEQRLQRYRDGWANAPEIPIVDYLPGWKTIEAKRYAEEKEVRHAVWDLVVRSAEKIPAGHDLVMIGHSLGSVIARDVLKHLPAGLKVKLLITIGSPIGSVPRFHRFGPRGFAFPYDRLGAWANIYEPRDVVTGGRGVGEVHPQVIDLPITLPDLILPKLLGQHGAKYYCTHKSVAAAISGALYSRSVAVPHATRDASRFAMPLLQCTYQKALGKQLPAKDFERIERFRRARRLTAEAYAMSSVKVEGQERLEPEFFLVGPEQAIRGTWPDDMILALAIALAAGPPAPPFLVEDDAKRELREKALIDTLYLVRRPGSATSDREITAAIYEALDEAEKALGKRTGWLPKALIGAGVIALAATGVGLAAAVPAGLAGAAAITATLAAFGPGGMIGGMATLAALAGAGSAVAAAGAALEVAKKKQQEVSLLDAALDEALRSGSPDALRSLLTSLITLVGAQERLQWYSQRDELLTGCLTAHAQATRTALAHDKVDPKSPAAKDADEMRDLLARACDWLRGQVSQQAPGAAEMATWASTFGRAVNTGEALSNKQVTRPGRSGQVPAIGPGGAS